MYARYLDTAARHGFAVILGGGFAIGSLFYSDKIALATAGANAIQKIRATAASGR